MSTHLPKGTQGVTCIGEVMAIGRTFQQAFAKAMRSRELDRADLGLDGDLLARLEPRAPTATT